MDNTDIALLLLILVASSSAMSGDCHVSEIADENLCGGELQCQRDFSEAVSDISQMPCLYLYMDYSEEYVIHQNFTITIKATDFQFTHNDSLVLNELKDHITAISITDGKITTFPDAILKLRLATEVDLSANKIESLNLSAFSQMSTLNTLNVSYNNIERLGVLVGSASSVPLNTIDLSHNKIQGVLQNVIPPYRTLRHLNLSFNHIESFGENEFYNLTSLLTLDISNNRIIQLGSSLNALVSVEKLLLDHNNLTSLNKNNLYGMSALKELNISTNTLRSIASSSFNYLFALQQLDISNNQINVLLKSTFQNNSLLRYLDVSYNNISEIESGAFTGAHIEFLKLHNNTLAGYLDTHAFNGLDFEKLDLSDGDIGELGPDLFGPHPSFRSLNFSKNVITKISKTTFRNLNLLVDLDLSYNKLQSIDFDTTDLKNLTYFYINNNAIKEINRATFEPLNALNMIDLSSNDIMYIESWSFRNLDKLTSLNLKDNPLPDILQHTFDGLISCYSLDLSGTKITKLQNNSFNGMKSLNKLDLSHSDIKVLEFEVFNGTGSIQFLDLSHNRLKTFSINQTNLNMQEMLFAWNNITSISKMSFQELNKVSLIDISHNSISNIQPGTFRDCLSLLILKLNHNNLSFLQYGVFDRLNNVQIIDLSNNRFHRFDAKLFYSLPNIYTVYLDDNFINQINLTEFSISNIIRLSIGGNLLSCDSLMNFVRSTNPSLPLRSRVMPLRLEAKNLTYNKENVNGIVCKSQIEIGFNQIPESKIAGNISLEEIINLIKGTNRYLAANLGVQFSAMLVALCIFVYFKFRSKLSSNRYKSASTEALSNAIELE